jgi:hypothetical protein
MKKKITASVLATLLVLGVTVPSFAQGNGGTAAASHATHHKKAAAPASGFYDTTGPTPYGTVGDSASMGAMGH